MCETNRITDLLIECCLTLPRWYSELFGKFPQKCSKSRMRKVIVGVTQLPIQIKRIPTPITVDIIFIDRVFSSHFHSSSFLSSTLMNNRESSIIYLTCKTKRSASMLKIEPENWLKKSYFLIRKNGMKKQKARKTGK